MANIWYIPTVYSIWKACHVLYLIFHCHFDCLSVARSAACPLSLALSVSVSLSARQFTQFRINHLSALTSRYNNNNKYYYNSNNNYINSSAK